MSAKTLGRPDRAMEIDLPGPVAGIDEAGRGPLCGPVLVACVILPGDPLEDLPAGLAGINDSKKISAARREALFDAIMATCAVGIAESSVAEIDSLNILKATLLGMRRAVAALPVVPGHVLVDGNVVPPGLPCPAQAVVGGDARCLAIAAASIIAKVTRDRIMVALDREFPGYGWAKHAGYGTPEHREAIRRLGPTPHHRRTFGIVREIIAEATA